MPNKCFQRISFFETRFQKVIKKKKLTNVEMCIRTRVSVRSPSLHFVRAFYPNQMVLMFGWFVDLISTISIGNGCIGCGFLLLFYSASSNHSIKVCNRTPARDELIMRGCDSCAVKGESTRSEKRDIK